MGIKTGLMAATAAAFLAVPASAAVVGYGGTWTQLKQAQSHQHWGAFKKSDLGRRKQKNTQWLLWSWEDFLEREGIPAGNGGGTVTDTSNVTQTPLPATGLMLLGGLAAVGAASRRKRKS